GGLLEVRLGHRAPQRSKILLGNRPANAPFCGRASMSTTLSMKHPSEMEHKPNDLHVWFRFFKQF
ncbi:MAG: hypothetical protein QNJ06_23130, partial [Kiloniellales bacterium]|nr:hypothetical protein [Kiloniellales bacterium]